MNEYYELGFWLLHVPASLALAVVGGYITKRKLCVSYVFLVGYWATQLAIQLMK